jgi:ornithine cyclodeaminase/alanine dehydrogenase-like protein (mu-crystallin family)
MLILTRQDIAALLTMDETIAALDAGFRQLAGGQVVMPQRLVTPVAPQEGVHLSMPAFVAGDPGTLTIKIVTVYPHNPARHGLPAIQGKILLHDAATGQLLALLDAEYLTAMRTGAVSGLATRHLARPDAAVVTLFGAGAQAGPQLAAVCAVRPIRQIYVITESSTKDADFCARMASTLGVPCTPMRNVEAAVRAAEIICTATNAETPLFDGAWLQPGTHINAVGAYKATMREVDLTTLQRSRVYVDHHPAAQTEAGDLLIPMAQQTWGYGQVVGTLGDVLTGQAPGRTNATEITFFKSVGLAMQDAVTVARVYALALARHIGTRIEDE